MKINIQLSTSIKTVVITIDQIQDVFLKDRRSAYVISVSAVIILLALIVIAMLLLNVYYVDRAQLNPEKASG